MKGNYPRFAESYSREELIEHFMLNETEQNFTVQFKGDANQHGGAILLKSLRVRSHAKAISWLFSLFLERSSNSSQVVHC